MTVELDSNNEKFDWAIYVDATLAGLAILIPIPLVDLFFEWIFKRRMPGAIAKRNGRTLSPTTLRALNRSDFNCLGCLLWPLAVVWLLLKRTYRTILYFLTIKEATDKLSYYWHRAYLLDFMMQKGHLENEEIADLSAQALEQVLNGLTTSPLTQLAQQIVSSGHHILRTSWRWLRRKQEDEIIIQTRAQMANAWQDLSGYFSQIRDQYLQRQMELLQAQLEASLVVDPGQSEAAVSPATPNDVEPSGPALNDD